MTIDATAAYSRTIVEPLGVRYQIVARTNGSVAWERFVSFGRDQAHRAGGSAFHDAARLQEEAMRRILQGGQL